MSIEIVVHMMTNLVSLSPAKYDVELKNDSGKNENQGDYWTKKFYHFLDFIIRVHGFHDRRFMFLRMVIVTEKEALSSMFKRYLRRNRSYKVC